MTLATSPGPQIVVHPSRAAGLMFVCPEIDAVAGITVFVVSHATLGHSAAPPLVVLLIGMTVAVGLVAANDGARMIMAPNAPLTGFPNGLPPRAWRFLRRATFIATLSVFVLTVGSFVVSLSHPPATAPLLLAILTVDTLAMCRLRLIRHKWSVGRATRTRNTV